MKNKLWLALATGLGGWIYARRVALRRVAPGLFHPFLLLPMHLLPEGAFVALSRLVAHVQVNRPAGPGVRVDVVEDVSPEGVYFRARRITPVGLVDPDSAPVMVWTHGGGHLLGSPGMYDPQNARVARELGMVVIAPEYPKSTAQPFPADLDACYAALRWVQERTSGPVAVCGDSAGGGLAAGLTQRALDEGHPVDFCGLVYPMLDHRLLSATAGRGDFIWTANSNRGAWSTYLGADHLSRELPPYASPLYRADFAGLPPTWVGVGSLDLFYDEALAYARATGAEFTEYPGAYHGFDQLRPRAQQSVRLIGDLIAAMRRALNIRA